MSNKNQTYDKSYIVVKPEKLFNSLEKAVIELHKLGQGFKIAKIVKGIARICLKCKISMGKNNFKFCPNCGKKF